MVVIDMSPKWELRFLNLSKYYFFAGMVRPIICPTNFASPKELIFHYSQLIILFCQKWLCIFYHIIVLSKEGIHYAVSGRLTHYEILPGELEVYLELKLGSYCYRVVWLLVHVPNIVDVVSIVGASLVDTFLKLISPLSRCLAVLILRPQFSGVCHTHNSMFVRTMLVTLFRLIT